MPIRWPSILFLLAATTADAAVPLEPDMSRLNQIELHSLEPGMFELRTTGSDPWFLLKELPANFDAERHHVLAFEYFCPDGVDELELFYGPPIEAGRSVSPGGLAKAETWTAASADLARLSHGRWGGEDRLLRLDWGRKPGVRARIRGLELRAPTVEELRGAEELASRRREKEARANKVNDYLDAAYPCRIESVEVRAEKVIIQGTVSLTGEAPLWIAELRPHHAAWEGEIGTWVQRIRAPEQSGAFRIELARRVGDRDRITSRWQVIRVPEAGAAEVCSHAVYTTDVSRAAAHDLEPIRAVGKKGMGGVDARDILPELAEMGVQHITVNLSLTGLFALTPGEDREEIEWDGLTLFVRRHALEQYDRLIGFATRHGMVVSAIVLIRFNGDPAFVGRIVHPEADPAGEYAMPNLATEAGARVYEAALAFLAERYARPGDPHGRITNWIPHNEVDYGWTWTNMGLQPLAVYLDTYLRSMRLCHLTARRFNPHARVFISLTHHWNVEPDPGWRSYSPRTMLEWLARYSVVEGDFDWGVAYHPYPQNLFKPDTWNDERAAHDFDTELITMKNIEVLDAWMRRPAMRRSNGEVRPVMLSEQGFHTADYGAAAQRLQAAALVYAWHKIQPLDSIEVFHNHRWLDPPHEGGLLLGVRTLPTGEDPNGERKCGGEVYQALGTQDEEA
ncbi:MAG TPA: DUF5722 domain-containing protein, partial [Methylomirabilota bacterium]|nr:DUF5722 domain-containing protein [Methylomirabilota bacterium]